MSPHRRDLLTNLGGLEIKHATTRDAPKGNRKLTVSSATAIAARAPASTAAARDLRGAALLAVPGMTGGPTWGPKWQPTTAVA